MAVKSFNPTSPARRQMTVADFSEITAKEPEKKPVKPTSDSGNISWTGQVTNPIQGQFGMMPQNQYRR